MKESDRKMESVVTTLYDEFEMPPDIKDVKNKFSSGTMVDTQKEGTEVEKLQDEKFGPSVELTICNKLAKNSCERDENLLLSLLALEMDQKDPRNQSVSVGLGKLKEGLTATAQQQPEGKKEKDLITGEVGTLNKDATSSPPLEKEQKEMRTDKERDRAFNRDVISSPSFEKKEEDLNEDKIGPKASDEVVMSSPSFEKKEEDLHEDKIGPKVWDEVVMSSPSFEKKEKDLNAENIGPKESDEVAMSSPFVSEKEEENLYTSKKSYKAAKKNKFKDERFERRRADSDPRQDLSSKTGKVHLVLCLAFLVIGKSEGNQEPNCDWPKEPISKLYFLKRNETCMSHNVNLHCGNDLQLCLPVIPGSDLAIGCARDRPINGKGCPEWNDENGCYVFNVRFDKCKTCSDFYLLSNSSEVEKCFKDERVTATEQTTGISAKGTPDKGTSFEHGDETTAGSPNKTSGKSQGNNEPEIVIIIVAVVMLIGTPFVVVAVIKVRNRCRNPDTEQQQPVEGSSPEELQPVAGSNPEQQQPFVRSDPEQQQPFVRSDPEQQQPFVRSDPEQQQPFVRSDPEQQQPFVQSDPEQRNDL